MTELVPIKASTISMLGAASFGLVIGWFIYYVNRYRKDDVQLGDIVTLIGAIGGAAVLALFDAKSDLFGAYGIGLAIGFFGYFTALLLLVRQSTRTTRNFDWDWFLDGRRKDPKPDQSFGPDKPMLRTNLGEDRDNQDIR